MKIGGNGAPLLRLYKHNGILKGNFIGWSGFMTLQGNYWTNSEDTLEPPLDHKIEKLFKTKPYKFKFDKIVDTDCLFFICLHGIKFNTIFDINNKNNYTTYTVYEPQSELIIILHQDKPIVDIYGNKNASKNIRLLINKWFEYGMPRIIDYKVELLYDKYKTAGDGWILNKPNATLRLTL